MILNYKNITKYVLKKHKKINDYFIISLLIKNYLRIIATKVIKKFKNTLKIRKFVSTVFFYKRFIRSNI